CHELKACEDDGIVAYVPQGDRTAQMEAQGRFSHEQFVYDAENDVYRCPAGQLLRPTGGRKITAAGRVDIRYRSRKSECDCCALRSRCVTENTPTRTIQRWEHEPVLERHRARMKASQGQMQHRAELAEHPFGTLKCRAGYRHFLVRGFNKVRGEWSLMALCYNLSRVLNILGLDRLIAYFARRISHALFFFFGLVRALAAAFRPPRTLPERVWTMRAAQAQISAVTLKVAA
ncbi:MAG TPA: transposase, partial [Xanthobacteraceae bacterium]